jgi:hypothetical protein
MVESVAGAGVNVLCSYCWDEFNLNDLVIGLGIVREATEIELHPNNMSHQVLKALPQETSVT